MAAILKKSFNKPDDIKTPEKVKMEIVTVNNVKIHRVTAEPGWQWSKHIKPLVGGESCTQDHLLYVISGTLASRMDGGAEETFSQGEVASIPPGHDGWTVGDEPAVWLEIPH